MARDDEKTQMAPAGRPEPRSGATGSDRTEFVDLSGETRRPPSGRLSWPARDQHMVRASEASPDDRPTKSVARPAAPGQDESKTILYRPGAPAEEMLARPGTGDRPRRGHGDPVVGWLVVVSGMGVGASVEIGMGANPIGRDAGQALRLDFGDAYISRERHAILVYDPRGNRFYLQPGDARNLCYVDGEVVLAPVPLKGGERIALGQTETLFVALCGESFKWG